MGASREGYNILDDIKNKNWKRVKSSVLDLIIFWRKSWYRRLIILDTFITPFNKKFGCKLFGHNWKEDQEDNEYICWKCYKRESISDRKSNERQEKLEKILK